jgi:antitoxin (DNA-binding transcriptional repressor) of toxin-antitoxin stability system
MSRVDGDDPLVYTVRDLNQRTASIISAIEMAGKPAFITRHGQFVAMITPLASGQVESHVLAEMARKIGEPTATGPQPPSTAAAIGTLTCRDGVANRAV